jgi:hypothetical protein
MSAKALLSASVSAPSEVYVEDVFSTFLYTGTGAAQTITNEIDLAGKGGLVWLKNRNVSNYSHNLVDSARGTGKTLISDSIAAQTVNSAVGLTSFNSNGFTTATNAGVAENGTAFVSWTFRKAEKFFDVVTYTGTGADQTISHNLDSTPGCIIVKQTSGAGGDWYVYHRSLSIPSENWIRLNNTGAANGYIGQDLWGPPTSTTFKVANYLGLSTSSATYVAYLFAHDAGGFGDDGSESIIKCGSYTGTGSNVFVNLGWEPQWVLTRGATWTDQWAITDIMRGMPVTGDSPVLFPNLFNDESIWANLGVTATGFNSGSNQTGTGQTYIYIAIRRGPMKTPTDATTVFKPAAGYDFINAAPGFPVDMYIAYGGSAGTAYSMNSSVGDRLRGRLPVSVTSSANAESTTIVNSNTTNFQSNTSWINNIFGDLGVQYLFRRAPGFFDVVAWTASASTSITHGLGVTPELIIAKSRSVSGESWNVYTQAGGRGNVLFLDTTNSNVGIADHWGTSGPTATTFGVAASGSGNNNGNMIAYLFATLTGVSKVGSYTGTGTTLSVDCGFTAGARFVLIKRTDSTGDWYVWDTARGIISGNDPYLLLNSTAAEVTNTDYIDPLSSGFQISSTAPAAINASGGSFIFLAIA